MFIYPSVSYLVKKKSSLALFATGLILISIIAVHGTGYMFVATCSYLMMIAGLMLRAQKNLHYKLMSMAILLDLSIVLILEIQRHAINTAISLKLTPLQQAHIYASSVATLLYIPIVILGILSLQGYKIKPSWHKRLGIAAFVFRTLGFILMFSLIGRSH